MNKFVDKKKKALGKLEDALRKGWFDQRFHEIIYFLNSVDGIYTTSCCSGRISVYHTDLADSKKEHEFLGKFHEVPSFSDISNALKKTSKDVVYYSTEPLILHVCCNDIDAASIVLECAYSSGLKRSGIFQVKDDEFMIEVRGVDGFSAPLSGFGEKFFDEKYIQFLLGFSAVKLEKNWRKMDKFCSALKEAFKCNCP